MASNKLEISAVDFDQIKVNLKTFLQSQSEFQDYNFEGSGFAILLDLLAYNTHYLSYNTNVVANEMFLDSADLRSSIVSLAKMLGYTPTSPRAPIANIDILINNGTGTSVTMTKGTVFTTSVDGTSYQFVTNADFTITPTSGVYRFSNVNIFEGSLTTFKYTVNTSDPDQKFIIQSNRADTSTLRVRVQNSSVDTTTTTYTLATGITELSATSKVYFIQETEDGRFEVYFGDGIIGQSLSDGNIVILEYIVTNTIDANDASSFSLSGSIDGFTNVTVTTNSSAQGGSVGQTKESIRFNAPLQYAAQDRAVTTTDYETLVREIYPNAQSVSAWGGEDDETPIYGVVKIAIKAASGSTLTNTTKNSIITQLKKFNVASVRPEIIDPETTSILLTSTVKFDENSTTKSASTLKSQILTALNNYNTANLERFDKIFRYSKIVELIDDVDTSILSNITTIKMRKTLVPILNTSSRYNIYFRNGIYNPHSGHKSAQGGVIVTSGFRILGDSNNRIYFLDDDGIGNIRRYHLTGSTRNYDNNTQGTVNYATGEIVISSLNISVVENIRGAASSVIEITTEPNSNDIVPVRDQIISIDTSNSSITVEADTFVGGSADAGVGYTTTSSYN